MKVTIIEMGLPSSPGTKPYRPANGTEGEIFYEQNCARCLGERAYRESNFEDGSLGCPILARSYAFDVDDPNYPKEWVRDDVPYDEPDNARCTAFKEDRGQEIPPPRCTETPDLFGGV